MKLGVIGLGKMGANMARRLVGGGHEVIGYDLDPAAIEKTRRDGVSGAGSLEDMVAGLGPEPIVWIMVPHGEPVDAIISALRPLLPSGATIIDGGNSRYRETVRRHRECAAAGHHLVDVGTSGGIWGLTEGYSMMIGGEPDPVERLRPVFETLAPDVDKGWGHVGPAGAGHFTKMVHNGIEYGIMQAYAEGLAILRAKEQFELDLAEVGRVWRHGSVIRSWLLDLTVEALRENPEMEGIAPHVEDSGEGRWTVFESIELNVAAPVITHSLLERIGSRDDEGFSRRLVAAMRNRFGGHEVMATDGHQ